MVLDYRTAQLLGDGGVGGFSIHRALDGRSPVPVTPPEVGFAMVRQHHASDLAGHDRLRTGLAMAATKNR